MSPIAPALDRLAAEIATLTAELGCKVEVRGLGILDRAGHLPLQPPGAVSPNGACRLVRAADGWIAVNLAREEDRELIAAWLEAPFGEETWASIEAHAPRRRWRELRDRAALLGLPVAGVGEVTEGTLEAPRVRLGAAVQPKWPARVLDLSALWAGPMCGAVLAAAGASVTRVESLRRSDPTRTHTPDFFRRLNGAKAELQLDLASAAGRARLRGAILEADLVITSARPRGLASLGLSPAELVAARPGLTWVAVTGYGFQGAGGERVAFGDDAAAAGGLVRWSADGAPAFLGDALADPLTGLAAAAGALRAVKAGGGMMVDAAMARCAAGAAALCGLRRAA